MKFDFCRKIIPDVEEITVEDPRTFDEGRFAQMVISIRTKDSETYDIVLQADTPEDLAFHKAPDPNVWLTPKLYTGKSMHEEEMDA